MRCPDLFAAISVTYHVENVGKFVARKKTSCTHHSKRAGFTCKLRQGVPAPEFFCYAFAGTFSPGNTISNAFEARAVAITDYAEPPILIYIGGAPEKQRMLRTASNKVPHPSENAEPITPTYFTESASISAVLK